MPTEIKVMYPKGSYAIKGADQRALCLLAEDVIREYSRYGLVSFIVASDNCEARERVRDYLQGVMAEIANEQMEGM